jgi:hypothetical protein
MRLCKTHVLSFKKNFSPIVGFRAANLLSINIPAKNKKCIITYIPVSTYSMFLGRMARVCTDF